MGIYFRYTTAFLILLISLTANAATRKNVNLPSKESSFSSSDGSFQTPNGSAAYFGQDYVDEHTAGRRFNAGDNPTGQSGSDIRSKQKVKVKPVVTVNKRNAAKSLVKGVRGGIPGLIATTVVGAAVNAIGGFIEDNQVMVPTMITAPTGFTWGWSAWVDVTPQKACQKYIDSNTWFNVERVVTVNGSTAQCSIKYGTLPQFQNYSETRTFTREGDSCAVGDIYNPETGACLTPSTPVAATDADWIKMEDWLAVRDSDFVKDIVKATCEHSPAPGACYEEMLERGNLQGPSEQVGLPSTTTTTTQNPDGTTSTTSTTTQNRYNYSYSPTYYDYSTTTKTTINKDGEVTESETTDGLPTDEPTQEEDAEYAFSDSDLPEVPSFYEQKYPDGLQGVWQNISSQVDQSAFMQFLQGFVPSFSGSCPAFGLGFNIASWANYGAMQFSSICYALDFVKIILLVTALFTFRKVTFGG